MTIMHKILDGNVLDIIERPEMIPRINGTKSFSSVMVDPVLYLSKTVYNTLSELGTLTSIIFEQKPHVDKGNVHIDLVPTKPALNVVIEGQGVMKWFSPIGEGEVFTHPLIGIDYRAWFKPYYGTVLEEWTTGKIALVRTDVPHQVFNLEDSTRLIASIRWTATLSWEETLEWFNKKWK